MDQYLSTVIIAAITGIFSIITLIIQKKQDKVIDKIDEQTVFIEKEKSLKQRITKKQEEQESLIHEIMILILDTNLYIMNSQDFAAGVIPTDQVIETSENLKNRFNALKKEIDSINSEYEMLLELTKDFRKNGEKSEKS